MKEFNNGDVIYNPTTNEIYEVDCIFLGILNVIADYKEGLFYLKPIMNGEHLIKIGTI